MDNKVTGNRNNIGNNNNSGDIFINSQGNKTKILNDTLRSYGIEQNDINELFELLAKEKPSEDSRQLGGYAQAWINKIIEKAKKGIGSISLGITSSILAECIMKYYGVDQ